MAGWLERVESRVNRAPVPAGGPRSKAFTMPPFWTQDAARVALMSSSLNPGQETGGDGYGNYARNLYQGNGIVFSCVAARARVFSQGAFRYQRRQKDGRPGEFFNHGRLRVLQEPWPHGTSGELLASMEIDASLAGNAFYTVADEQGRVGEAARPDAGMFLVRLRPDWCTLVMGSPIDTDDVYHPSVRVIAVTYSPPGQRDDPWIIGRKAFAHFSPLPDPLARFRGMSWLTPIVREIAADQAYTDHKLAFLRNGAVPNMVINLGEDVDDVDFEAFVAKFRQDYEGARNAYKTLFLAGGADVTPLTVDFAQLDLKSTQGALETRIAAAGGVHPTIAGLSEGLAGSSLNAGNFGATRRLFVDSTIQHLWNVAAPSMQVLAPAEFPDREYLTIDGRDVPFLRDDAKDEAARFHLEIQAIRQGIEAGFEPDAVVKAAKARDPQLLLGHHTGMVSVQLQRPGQKPPADGDADPVPTLNGSNGNGRLAAAGSR